MPDSIIHAGLVGKVRTEINRHSLLESGGKVVVAISGGADSVALLAVLHELGYDCIAAHCNFHLRGEESQRDMRHVASVCRSLGVKLIVKDFDVAARMSETGESAEMACRELRYEWFDVLMHTEGCAAVAVGHHREDNIETLMLNILRGTGIDGLRGMKYRRDDIIRPLLDCTRQEIEAYLQACSLNYIVDSSNYSDVYMRNRLRNHIIPELLRLFPNAESGILQTMSNMASVGKVYDNLIDRMRAACEMAKDVFSMKALESVAGDDMPTVLFDILKQYGLSASQCHDIVRSHDRSGLTFEGRTGLIFDLDRGVLSLRRMASSDMSEEYDVDLNTGLAYPVNIAVSRHDINMFKPERYRSIIYLDASAVDAGHKWTLRRWRQGDRIKPFGMKGSKLVSDIFSDAKYSVSDKRDAWLLTCDGEIVWIVGLRSSRMFTVTPRTKQYIKLEYSKL